MCVTSTSLEHHPALGLWVKREDLSCPGGPNFSKTRGVWAHALARPESVIGVLDTAHSQGGWAVARACALLGKRCHLYYPVRKHEEPWLKPQQAAAERLGAELHVLPAGRSAVLYHRAKADIAGRGGYMFPNALKLSETVAETAREVARTALPPDVDTVLVSASSGTIAAGVIRGFLRHRSVFRVIVHLGYSRPAGAVRTYIDKMVGESLGGLEVEIVDEGYEYKDEARPGPTPPWPCNSYYDLKCYRWWMSYGREWYGAGDVLFWNVG